MSKHASNVAKGIAILMVLFHHLFYSVDAILSRSGGRGMSFFPFEVSDVVTFALSLKVCVAVFVFVTAYGTARQYQGGGIRCRSSITNYVISHLVKLLLGFQLVYVAFSLISFAFPEHTLLTTFNFSQPSGFVQVAIDFFGLAYFFGTPTLNSTWWYMSLAILLILLFPVFWRMSCLFGGFVIAMGAGLFSFAVGDVANVVWRYLPSFTLGICFAQYSIFGRVSEVFFSKSTGRRAASEFILLIALLVLLKLRQGEGVPTYLFDTLCAVIICLFSEALSNGSKNVSGLFAWYGRHSMNVFSLHTFLFLYYFTEALYSLPWFGFTFLALAAMSVSASAVIERVKESIGFNALVNRVSKWMEQSLLGSSSNYL